MSRVIVPFSQLAVGTIASAKEKAQKKREAEIYGRQIEAAAAELTKQKAQKKREAEIYGRQIEAAAAELTKQKAQKKRELEANVYNDG
jgi:hypothetical protein